MYITIRTKGIELTPDLKEFIEDKIGTLDKFHQGIMDGSVEIEKMTHHHKTGPFFRAHASLRLAYNKTIVSENSKEDIKIAINTVKDELQQEIKSLKKAQLAAEKRQGRQTKKETVIADEAKRPADGKAGGRVWNEGV